MKHALIDLGSNSVRMSVYEIEHTQFQLLFSEKETIGLAGYITNDNQMSIEGMTQACNTLKEFSNILKNLNVTNTNIFATASLRNITNTDACVNYIKQKTNMDIDVISGKDEATFGYIGALQDIHSQIQLIFDIGGGSTELVHIVNNQIQTADSCPIGSLILFKKNVSRLFPKKEETNNIKGNINKAFDQISIPQAVAIGGIGGTARALLKITNAYFHKQGNEINRQHFKKICHILLKRDTQARDLILKNCPDRVHTILPGTLIIQNLMKKTGCEKMIISKYGVREGYLCQKVLPMT